jgi:hypothetical protein
VWDESDAICELTSDWKTDNKEDGLWGFFISDPYGLCPYVEDEGWEYAWYEQSDDGKCVWGPYGYKWCLVDPEEFE